MRIFYVALAALVVACGSSNHGPSSLTVSPSSLSLAAGDESNVGAVFDNGDTTTPITWTSDDTAVATVTSTQNGVAIVTAVAAGSASITATGAGLTATVAVAVTAAELRAIGVTPPMPTLPVMMTLPLTATGTYSDSSTMDLTDQVMWSSSADAVATVTGSGVVDGVGSGAATITAMLDGISGTATVAVTGAALASIAVTPTNPTLAVGTLQPLTATGTFSDASTLDLTAMVTWQSDTPGVATVSGSGVVAAVAIGSASVSAALDGVSGATEVAVTAATIASIYVDPVMPTIGVATTQPFTATATLTDSTTQDVTASATWQSSDPAVATIDGSGLATAVAPGSAAITAQVGAAIGSAALTVTGEAVTAIEVTPANALVGSGFTIQLAATAIFADSTKQDVTAVVTWTSSDPAIAQVSNAAGSRGLATGLGSGTPTITAALGAVSGSTPLDVTASALAAIAIAPSPADVPLGVPQQFTATGTFADSSSADITANVTWASSNSAVAAISNADGSRGLATTVGTGSAAITAIAEGITGSAALTVDAPALESIDVSPPTATIAVGLAQQFTATGHYSNGSAVALTSGVTWSAGGSAVDIDPATGSATAVAVGSATITAMDGGVSGSAELTVIAPPALESITVAPASVDVVPGGTHALTATGTYSDGSMHDLTTAAAWTSSDPAIAQVSSAGGTSGTVTGIAVGAVTITAMYGSASGSASATVDGPAVTAITPPDGLAGVRTTPLVLVTFNQAIDGSTVTGVTETGACGGTIQLSKDGFATCVGFTSASPFYAGSTYAAFLPNGPLDVLATYQIKVSGAIANPASAGGATLGSDVVQAVGFTTATAGACGTGLVISQIYSGGGTAGAPFDADYVELHDSGPAAQSLAGLSLQYTAATGANWNVLQLPNATVPAGGYFLVKLYSNGSTGAALPAPDATGAINPSVTGGKLALVTSTQPLVSDCALYGTLDFIGYGSASCGEGSAALAALSNTAAALRDGGGCADTNDNGSDFATGAPAPRDGGSAASVCACVANVAAELDYCDLQFPDTMTADAGSASQLVYGQVYESGMTPSATAPIAMQVGVGASATDPSADASWAWTTPDMVFNTAHTGDNNNEYMGSFAAPATSGTYSYTTRASLDGVNWTYCDIDGNGTNSGLSLSTSELGTLTVP